MEAQKNQVTGRDIAGKFPFLALIPHPEGVPSCPRSARRTGNRPIPATPLLPDVLTAERAFLLQSREFLDLMREDVLSLKALGGNPVSEEYLKAELYHRAEALKDLPGTPLFFGRLDYRAGAPGPGVPDAPAGASR